MRFVSTLFLAGALAVPAVAYGQYSPPARPERPYRGLFGGGYGDTDQMLSLGLTFGGGYDTNVLRGTTLTSDGATTAATPQRIATDFGQADGTLSYSLSRKRVGVNAFGEASGIYYKALPNSVTPYYNAGAGAFAKVGATGQFTFGETTSYQPFYYLNLFPSLGDATSGVALFQNLGTAAQLSNYLRQAENVAFTTKLNPRVSFDATYGYDQQTSASHQLDLSSERAGAGLTFGLTRYLGLRLGYTQTENVSRTGDLVLRTPGNQIDAGLNYARSISLTRRLSFSFGTGAVGIRDQDTTHYSLVGNANLVRELGRTWSASVSYTRSVGFIAVFQQPVTSDGASVGLGGSFSRRVQFNSSLGATRGTIGFGNQGNGFNAYYGLVSLTCGISQTLGLGVSYSDYHSTFGSGIVLPDGLFDHSQRQTVRVFLSVWAPLFSRTRRPDAAR